MINNVSKGESEGESQLSTEVFNAVGKTGNGDITADLYKPNEIAFSEAERDGSVHTSDYIKNKVNKEIVTLK